MLLLYAYGDSVIQFQGLMELVEELGQSTAFLKNISCAKWQKMKIADCAV